jgi:hypothetical protein
VPSSVASTADTSAIRIVTQAASRSASLRNRAAYHVVEKPPQTVTNREALKE